MAVLFLFEKTPLAWGLPLLFLLATGGCVQTFAYRELDLPDKSFGEIWLGLQQVTRKMGYAADRNVTDRGKRVFQSTWETRLVFHNASRHRLRVEVERVGPDMPGWRVRCHAEKQRVGTIGRSLSPREEDWEPAGQEITREEEFMGQLRGQLGLAIVAPTSRPSEEPTRIR